MNWKTSTKKLPEGKKVLICTKKGDYKIGMVETLILKFDEEGNELVVPTKKRQITIIHYENASKTKSYWFGVEVPEILCWVLASELDSTRE